MPDLPLLVFGPRSLDYDFGPAHPLTPRRFGPGIDLLREVGADPGLAPEPATDDDLLLGHTRYYLDVVKRFSEFDHSGMEAEADPEVTKVPFTLTVEDGAKTVGVTVVADTPLATATV